MLAIVIVPIPENLRCVATLCQIIVLEIAGGSWKIVPGSGTNCRSRIPGNLCNPGGSLSVTSKQTNKQTKYCAWNPVGRGQIAEKALEHPYTPLQLKELSPQSASKHNDTHGGEVNGDESDGNVGDDVDEVCDKASSSVNMQAWTIVKCKTRSKKCQVALDTLDPIE